MTTLNTWTDTAHHLQYMCPPAFHLFPRYVCVDPSSAVVMPKVCQLKDKLKASKGYTPNLRKPKSHIEISGFTWTPVAFLDPEFWGFTPHRIIIWMLWYWPFWVWWTSAMSCESQGWQGSQFQKETRVKRIWEVAWTCAKNWTISGNEHIHHKSKAWGCLLSRVSTMQWCTCNPSTCKYDWTPSAFNTLNISD